MTNWYACMQKHKLFTVTTNKHWHPCTIYKEDKEDMWRKKTEVRKYQNKVHALKKKYRHLGAYAQITQTPKGSHHPDKTGSLRAILQPFDAR